MDVLDVDVDEEDETTDVLKLAHAIAGIDRDTIRYNQELNTLTENFKVESEALEHVQDRVTSVTSELNAVLSGEQTETVSEVRQLGTRSAWSKFQNVAAWPRAQSTHTRPKGKGCSAASRVVPPCPRSTTARADRSRWPIRPPCSDAGFSAQAVHAARAHPDGHAAC